MMSAEFERDVGAVVGVVVFVVVAHLGGAVSLWFGGSLVS